ncbi:MAG: hypothetical protein K1V99_11865 [Bacteroidales bacterium]|nr:hypothetical protein [Bacteroidales bacterium]
MRRITIFIIVALLFSSSAFSQNTIKFLGIPIDGTKREMIDALKVKGYTYNSVYDVLQGEFNGEDVNISVQTVNNMVWRICVADESFVDETNIRIRYNNLFRQFSNNGKYKLWSGEKLDDKDDISYEMTVHKKRYEAVFYPKDTTINGWVWYMISKNSGKYGIYIFYENFDNAAKGDDL